MLNTRHILQQKFQLLALLSLALTAPIACRPIAAQEADAAATPTAPAETAAVAPEDSTQGAVLKSFAEAVAANTKFSDQQRAEVAQIVATAQGDPQQLDTAVTSSLSVLYPEFAQAMTLLGDEDIGAAVAALQKLAASDDLFLAAEANFYIARAHIMQEDFEAALPILNNLADEKYAGRLMYAGEAMFLRGISQARLLKRSEAQQSLSTFIEQFPAAPERLVVGAKHQLSELEVIEDGSIVDVQDRMEYSRRRLALERSDKPTQNEQDNIIAMLEKLIEEAEQKESQGSGSGSASGSGSGRGPGGRGPGSGADQSTTPEGSADVGSLDPIRRGKQGEGWGGLRDKKREEVLSAMKAKFPERYKQLVEQYYKSLQDEESSGE